MTDDVRHQYGKLLLVSKPFTDCTHQGLAADWPDEHAHLPDPDPEPFSLAFCTLPE
ncbi:MAG: hypothetical protein JSS23_00620 [Proteobacteria bacterium]|nr:hypothetical protein [Pseudomonadota bacterium]